MIRIMQPIQVTEDNIFQTDIPLETPWTSGSYPLGTQRRVDERLYEVSAETTTEEPSETATEWFDIGPANRYAAFDLQFGADKFRVIETKTTGNDYLFWDFRTLSQITGIAFFGVKTEKIKVTVDGVVIIDYNLADGVDYEGSFWRWAFIPSDSEDKYVNLDIEIPAQSTILVELSNPGANIEVASILMGIFQSFETMETGVTRSLRSRSIKDTTGTLTSLLRRTASSRITYPLHFADRQESEFWRLVRNLEGVAALFSAPDDFPELTVYGFITNAQSVAKANGISKVKLEVETL